MVNTPAESISYTSSGEQDHYRHGDQSKDTDIYIVARHAERDTLDSDLVRRVSLRPAYQEHTSHGQTYQTRMDYR